MEFDVREVPVEILHKILYFAGWRAAFHLRLVSRFLKEVADDDLLWCFYYIDRWGSLDDEESVKKSWRLEYFKKHRLSCCVCDGESGAGCYGIDDKPLCHECYRSQSLVLRVYDA